MDRNTVIKGLERCRDRIKDDLSQTDEPCNSCPYAVSGNVCSPWELYDDTIALLKEQEETIKELQNAYDYLQKQFFEAQDKLLKEQEAVVAHWDDDTGHWIEGDRNGIDTHARTTGEMIDTFRCSWCGFYQYWKTPFCPNCGAKMERSVK